MSIEVSWNMQEEAFEKLSVSCERCGRRGCKVQGGFILLKDGRKKRMFVC